MKYRFYRNGIGALVDGEFVSANREDAIRIAEILGSGTLIEYRGGRPVAQAVNRPDGWYRDDWSKTSTDPRSEVALPPDLDALDAKFVDGRVERGTPAGALLFGVSVLVLFIPGVLFGLLSYILCTSFLW